MKSLITPGLVILILLLSACSLGIPAADPTETTENEATETETAGLAEENQALKQQIEELQQTVYDLEDQVTLLHTELNEDYLLSLDNPVYENDSLSLEVAPDWQVAPVGEGPAKAINVTKDNFILYINPDTTQASGAPGGRFSEIAQGAPGADLVMLIHPNEPCGIKSETTVTETLNRYNFTISKADITETFNICNAPESGSAWYFSYFSNESGNYFVDSSVWRLTDSGPLRQVVITMTYDTDSIDALPPLSDPDTQSALADVDRMIKSLTLK